MTKISIKEKTKAQLEKDYGKPLSDSEVDRIRNSGSSVIITVKDNKKIKGEKMMFNGRIK